MVPNVPCGVEINVKGCTFVRAAVVPNVPCGVEISYDACLPHRTLLVPNVPCGVEILVVFQGGLEFLHVFLMYRVEMKYTLLTSSTVCKALVPNVPCGVEIEATVAIGLLLYQETFLMYRVELKS